jgi:hypothetical protein
VKHVFHEIAGVCKVWYENINRAMQKKYRAYMFGNTGMLETWLRVWFNLDLRIYFKMYVDVFDRSQVKVDAETNFL